MMKFTYLGFLFASLCTTNLYAAALGSISCKDRFGDFELSIRRASGNSVIGTLKSELDVPGGTPVRYLHFTASGTFDSHRIDLITNGGARITGTRNFVDAYGNDFKCQ